MSRLSATGGQNLIATGFPQRLRQHIGKASLDEAVNGPKEGVPECSTLIVPKPVSRA